MDRTKMNFDTPHEKNTFFIHIFLVFLFYVIGDIFTTHYAITNGLGTEYNSMLASFLNTTYGFVYLTIIKLLYLLILSLVCYQLLLKNYKKTYYCLIYYVILLGIIITVSNTCVILTGETIIQYLNPL